MRDTEEVELEGLIGWHRAASAAGLSEDAWRLVNVGDAICSVCPLDHSILLNRVLGLGSKTSPTVEQLAEIKALYRQAGVSRFFVHVLPELAESSGADVLTAAGYRRYRGWMKFTRGPGPVPEVRADLSVRRIGAGEAVNFAAIAAPAFDLTPAFEPAVAALANDSRWQLFMSFKDGQAAGTGALFIASGIGYLDWGATHPDFRKQGSQSAILGARLFSAFDAGCQKIVTMTGEAVEGDPQHSYRNILRAGFSEAYLRENWIPVES